MALKFKDTNKNLSGAEIDKLTPAQQNLKIQELIEQLSEKISAEHFILLLEALDKNPALAEKAINFLPML